MFALIDRLEQHLKAGVMSKEALRALFSNVEIPDEAFEDPHTFCEKLRRNPLAYIEIVPGGLL